MTAITNALKHQAIAPIRGMIFRSMNTCLIYTGTSETLAPSVYIKLLENLRISAKSAGENI